MALRFLIWEIYFAKFEKKFANILRNLPNLNYIANRLIIGKNKSFKDLLINGWEIKRDIKLSAESGKN